MPPSPKPMAAILLLFSAAVLFSITSAASSPQPPARRRDTIEKCVKLLFDPPATALPKLKRILCRDLLRSIVISFKVNGKLSPEYVQALEKLPKFKRNPGALKKFLCGLSPAEKFGCTKSENPPITV
ncbi:hypothetical protein Salat_1030900 [Sesamum alatum]|uniref:Uncharacterized protein n=1 Tax=Sesamum alatum TaxID=300844 RepID=A0AAE1YME8_9LAMI|nr:hypothetical protein Salat_1030900 [Sesamum alatum]